MFGEGNWHFLNYSKTYPNDKPRFSLTRLKIAHTVPSYHSDYCRIFIRYSNITIPSQSKLCGPTDVENKRMETKGGKWRGGEAVG